ncbi:MAG: LLM class flavin-dependent oxidoreductase [Dehalococcoidia bacterium]|nr:LLM class flavin-dependent oxidoreductase [Dehalococcoidia bacterium]
MAMEKGRIGIAFQELAPAATLEAIARADAMGVPSWWLATGGAGPDALTLFAAAAARTRAIRMGTSIVPTFPRHPLVTAQQAQVIVNLAPGRLALGVGPSHGPIMAGTFGIPFERPLEHLSEYVTVLKAALQTGRVDFDGARFHVHAQAPYPAPVPVMVSALQANSFRLAGRVADGAISWICPASYLRDVAMPALKEGAAQGGRPVPPLVAHAFIALSEDGAAVAASVRKRMAMYPRLPSYANMLVAAGYPEVRSGEWSDAMLDAVVIHGDEASVAAGLRSFMDTAGSSELIASLIPTGADIQADLDRAMRLIASL